MIWKVVLICSLLNRIQPAVARKARALADSADPYGQLMPQESSVDPGFQIEGGEGFSVDPSFPLEEESGDLGGPIDEDLGDESETGTVEEPFVPPQTETDAPNFELRTEVFLEFRIEYGFFEDIEVRDPTEAELDGLAASTERFYTDLFSATPKFGDFSFRNFEIESRTLGVAEFDWRPVLVEYTAYLFFALQGPNNDLEEEEIKDVMQSAGNSDYVSLYVHDSEPYETIFRETQQVHFSFGNTTTSPTWSTESPTSILSPTTSSAPTATPITASLAISPVPTSQFSTDFSFDMSFQFFDEVDLIKAQNPSEEEIQGLLVETTEFYQKFLDDEYDSEVSRFAILDAEVKNEISDSDYPLVIEWTARIEMNTTAGDVAIADIFEFISGEADYSDYIQNYAWVANPEEGLFFEVNAVLVDNFSVLSSS